MIGNLVGSYKITDKIGEGGMGAVFRGIDVMLEREVAVKMLRPELSQQPNIVERFRSEAVTLAKLNHPNIATLYSFVRQGDDFFMVMEFVRGETLDGLIRRSGVMPCDRAIGLMCQALEGIEHAHKMGIIHRDVKPANMMMTEGGTLKVMDFGIARVLGTARMTKQGNIVGTIEYMSPEQVRGQDTDARSDIYSLGILLYEMLTGRVPFSSDSEFDLMKMQIDDAPQPPRVFSAQIPQAVEQAIMRALAKKPEARFQSAADFRNALLSASGAVAAPSIGSAAVASPPATRMGEAPTVLSPVPGVTAKETRLGTDASAGFQADQLKPTRLGGEANASLAYGAGGPAAAMYQQAAPPAGKSNAKLFIGIAAAAVLVAIVGISVVLLSGGRIENTISPAPVTQPAPPTTPQPAPSAGAGQPSMPAQTAPPQLESPKPAADGLSGGAFPAGENPNAGKTAKATHRENDAEAAARKEKARKAAEARRLLDQ
jgi:tRNA A-37 threonylcarbamoyl transferase component Bud32